MPDDRETRDLLVEIRTRLDVALTKQEDHESRIRDLYQRIATCVTGEDLRIQRRQVIAMATVCVTVVGGVVGLVTALT
ncbi:hypothetical protein FHX37_0507 [Haloactinospora alba]|uniref:Uncharacterized protein n=1 Tax=Haloactinospora alba TaxID=405555 RepID=A0A543NFL8_9ACTN|nr:hypothetical protein [Haloactinospora alba]TQN30625.1 hypothetical protein FHX37_0507 [Haloactinospora alba]